MSTTITSLSRRKFLATAAAAGGGLALGIDAGGIRSALSQIAIGGGGGDELGVWVFIKPNEDVVIRIARSEMGQGSLTGLAQLVAEELDCDWSKVTAEYPTPGQNLARNRAWGDMSTGGSRGIRGSQDYVRQGGAAARQMLLQAAANEWKVPVEQLKVDKGVITHEASKRTTTYGKVATAAAKLPVPDLKTMQLRDPKDWKIAGKPMKRLDTADKLTGKLVYAIDVKLPGMLTATIMDAPVFGNKLLSYDEAKVKAMPGVKGVYRVGDTAVAVVANTFWQAKLGLDALDPKWEETANNKVSSETIAAALREGLTSKDGVFVGNKAGDADAAIAGAAKKVEAVYENPYWHHVTMEPMNCTAKWTAEKCEVWVATQNGEASLAACAEAAGLPPSQVRGLQASPRRRLRPARLPGLHHQGRAARQADPGRAGEDHLDARGGHAPGPAAGRSGSARWKPASTTRATSSASRCAFPRSRSWPTRRRSVLPRAAWTRSPSRVSIPAAPRVSSATPYPTC